MIAEFNLPNLTLLKSLGYQVQVACNFEQGNTCSGQKIERLKRRLKEMDIPFHQIDFPRSVNPLALIRSGGQLRKLLQAYAFDVIHTHTPLASALVRMEAGGHSKVIYTAHGLHFFKGAPLHYWLLYYPIERWLAKKTDVLITINQEDFHRAKAHLKAKRVVYISGIGVDVEAFFTHTIDKAAKRKELGLEEDDTVFLSVGELSKRKNHQVMIRALGQLNRPNLHYLIAGQGQEEQRLLHLARNLGVNLHLLGYREDVKDLYALADVFCLPSKREGLGIAGIEAMAMGLPLLTSHVGGIQDYAIHGVTGYVCEKNCPRVYAQGIEVLLNLEKRQSFSLEQPAQVAKFDIRHAHSCMVEIYGQI